MPNKAVQTEPVTCSFQARSGQEFSAEWGDGVKTMVVPAAAGYPVTSRNGRWIATRTSNYTNTNSLKT